MVKYKVPLPDIETHSEPSTTVTVERKKSRPFTYRHRILNKTLRNVLLWRD